MTALPDNDTPLCSVTPRRDNHLASSQRNSRNESALRHMLLHNSYFVMHRLRIRSHRYPTCIHRSDPSTSFLSLHALWGYDDRPANNSWKKLDLFALWWELQLYWRLKQFTTEIIINKTSYSSVFTTKMHNLVQTQNKTHVDVSSVDRPTPFKG